MDEIQYEVDGDGFAVPDVPHMEIMMDALDQTADQIDGTECYTLTEAQRYAQGVLMAAGVVSARQITGNEGLFSAIGDGFAAAWKYIKETFQSIWNFFFARDSDKEAEAAKEEVSENNDKLEKAENGTQSEEEANKQLGQLESAANAAEGGGEAVAKQLKEAKKKSLAEKRAAIKAALKEIPKMNKKARQKLEGSIAAAVKAKKAFLTVAQAGVTDKEKEAFVKLASNLDLSDVLKDLENEVTKFGPRDAGYVKQLEGALNITDAKAAIAFGKATEANIDQVKALSTYYKNKKSKIDSIMKTTEANLKKAKEAKDKDALKKEIAALRVLVGLGTRVSKLIEANYQRVKVAHADLVKVFAL